VTETPDTARLEPDSHLARELLASPNFGERRAGAPLDALILHYTGMPDPQGALDWLRDPTSQVSCHYVVFEDGRIVQLVPESRRAWHAGRSHWAGESDMNSRSIGIEIANPGHDGDYPDFTDAQVQATIALCRDILKRNPIPPDRVLAHSDIAPGRKRDPGEKFPWERLARAGIGHWVPPAPIAGGRFFGPGDEGPPVEALQAMFAMYGFGITINGAYDAETEQVVTAFQRHFRPARVDGIADASTITTLRDLIAARANLTHAVG
jgi:N-acetylmuramoyl-L-alanine amidase